MPASVARTLSWAILATVLFIPLIAFAAAEEVGPTLLHLRSIPGPDLPAGQFLQADSKGRIFLLVADTLEVYPMDSTGVGEPEKLVSSGGMNTGSVLDAAMDRSSGDWLLKVGPDRLRQFRSGEEKQLPLVGWLVTSVAYLDGKPAAWVAPAQIGSGPPAFPADVENPALFQLGDSRWELVFDEWLDLMPEKVEKAGSIIQLLHGYRDVKTCKDSDGGIWVGNQHCYRVRHFASSGRQVGEITVGKSAVDYIERSAAEMEMLAEGFEKAGVTMKNIPSQRMKEALEGIAEGSDGRLYALVAGEFLPKAGPKHGGEFALDRFDPVRLVYERVLLGAKDLPFGRIDMAAGHDGLYFATYADNKRWWLSWEELEKATWEEVKDANLDGVPLGTPEPPEQ